MSHILNCYFTDNDNCIIVETSEINFIYPTSIRNKVKLCQKFLVRTQRNSGLFTRYPVNASDNGDLNRGCESVRVECIKT